MKAAVGTPNGLEVRDIPPPKPKPNEVLVRVRAAGLNRSDLGSAVAKAHPSHNIAGTPIGREWAGEVEAVGADVRGFKAGDRVMCYDAGAFAEHAVADAGRTLPIPATLSFEDAAVLPVALATMHDAIVTNGRLKAGESALMQGASSGVGIMGLMIAKLMGARLVIGSSTNDVRRARLKEFGADLVIDTRDPTWPEAVLTATDGKGVNLIVDMISGGVASGNMKAAAILGRIVNVGRLGGMKGEFDFDLHALRRIDYIGVTFRTRSPAEVHEILRRMRADLWEAVGAGKLRLPIDRRFSLDESAAALAHMRANRHFGKVVIVP